MIKVPRGGNCEAAGCIGWFFQYGRWDLRFNCPKCNKLEEFMFTLDWVDDDGIISDPGICRSCGCAGPFKLLDFTQKYLDRADEKEKRMAERFGGRLDKPGEWRFGSDLTQYDRKLPK